MVGVCNENGKNQARKNSQFVETTWYERKRGRPQKKSGEEPLKGKKGPLCSGHQSVKRDKWRELVKGAILLKERRK